MSRRPAVAFSLLLAILPVVAQAQIVINEIDYDQPGTDAAEFIELYNAGSGGADLSTYTLELVNGTGGGATVYNTIALPSVTLAAGDYFVVCGNAATTPNCDLDVSPDTNLIQNGAPDAVGLRNSGTLVDAVSYEGDSGAPYTEGSGAGLADDSAIRQSRHLPLSQRHRHRPEQRRFQPALHHSGRRRTRRRTVVVGYLPNVVINEIDYDQPGTDAAEFIELYNAGSGGADLSTYTLELVNGTGGGATVYNTIALPSVTLAAGDYFVVCGNAATTPNCDLDVSPDTNLIQNGAPDAVGLRSSGTLVDAVSYEGDSGAPYTEGSGAGLADDSASDNLGISRYSNGTDTDQNNVDFSLRCITPGDANTSANSGCGLSPELVINEIDYDQPGTDAAEFIELYNAGSGGADLSTYTLELVNGTGGGATVYNTIALPSVTLAAGDYFVVCGNAATTPNCDLDASPDTNLIQNGAPDAVGLRNSGTLVDAVSYEGDTGAPYTEGSGDGLADDNATNNLGISRYPNGTDTDQNNVDFSLRCITPGEANTASSSSCPAPGSPTLLEIFEIQGNGLSSPWEAQPVTTEDNIVTALASNGFFIQTPDAQADADAETSNGIFVFTASAPTVSVGDQVDVTGVAAEFFDFTEISGALTINIDSSGNALPTPVVLDGTDPSPLAPQSATAFERYEGMRVQVNGGRVTGPSQSFGGDPIAEVYVVAGGDRTYREPGVEYPGIVGLPVWDGNPEVFELDPDRLGLPNATIAAGSMYDATGVLGYEFGGYELWPTSLSIDQPSLPIAVRSRMAGEMTTATQNVFRLFDDVDDPGSADDGTVPSTAGYELRLRKLSLQIRTVLGAPDVLALQEVEHIGALQDLAGQILADDGSLVYTAYLVEGNDVGGIDVGFLVRDTVAVDAVTQLGAAELLTYDNSLLHDRPPVLLEGSYLGNGAPFPFKVLVVHMRSLTGIDDPVDGPRVRQKRLEQAQSVAQMAQNLQMSDPMVRLILIGDFNAYEFTDGYVDLVGQIKGSFVPADNLLSGPDLVDPDLVDEVLSLPTTERYSFVFEGTAQALDHALTSAGLMPFVRGLEYGRSNADAATWYQDQDATPLRCSDHDGAVLYVMTDANADGVPDDAPQFDLTSQTGTTADGTVSDDTGIVSLVLLPGSDNVTLSYTGSPGDPIWSWHIMVTDPGAGGTAILEATDEDGHTAVLVVRLNGAVDIPTLAPFPLALLAVLMLLAGSLVLRGWRMHNGTKEGCH